MQIARAVSELAQLCSQECSSRERGAGEQLSIQALVVRLMTVRALLLEDMPSAALRELDELISSLMEKMEKQKGQ